MNNLTLKDCCTFQEGYVNPSQKNREYFKGPIKWLRASDLNDGFVYNTEQTLSKKGFDSAGKSAFLFNVNTIAISKSGTIGRLGILKDRMCGNRAVINIDVDKNLADLYYVFYTLFYKKPEILSKTGGSIQKNLYVSALETISLNHRELQAQKQIAKVLSDLDAKIELNNKINAQLEAMAKLIYDYWFVQFEFSTSEAQTQRLGNLSLVGKPYKSSGGKMVYNPELKREIPEGWEVKSLSEIAKTGSGGTPLSTKKEYYENGDIPWINSGEVNEPWIVSTNNFITQKGLENSSAKIFPKGTILMAMYGATAGKVSLIDFEACTNQAICGINPNDEFYKLHIKFGLEDLYKYLINLSSGSARDNLSQNKIKDLRFIIPSEGLLIEFDKLVRPFMNNILINLKQNQKLSELRDWLLPMLMNGQVRVANALEKGNLGEVESGLGMVAEESENYYRNK